MKINFKQYGIYLFRWQLSTPILAIVLITLNNLEQWTATIVANFIGGLIFFWVDRFIFASQALKAQWEVEEEVQCCDCQHITRGYRLIRTKNYNKTKDIPKFRCENCSKEKIKQLQNQGIII